jgi:hypothetical protein
MKVKLCKSEKLTIDEANDPPDEEEDEDSCCVLVGHNTNGFYGQIKCERQQDY